MIDLLSELARQVRGWTIQLLQSTPERWLSWAPAGTANHMLWHAGHSVWVQDILCIEPLTGRSELPQGWSEMFGAQCRPVAQTQQWPAPSEVGSLLSDQLQRMLDLFEEADLEKMASPEPVPTTGWPLLAGILHGLHDEARHHGEMYLLFKLCRAGHISLP